MSSGSKAYRRERRSRLVRIERLQQRVHQPHSGQLCCRSHEDDGSCTYQSLCGSGTVWSASAGQCVSADPARPQDVNGDGVIGVSDILELLSFFGLVCADLLVD